MTRIRISMTPKKTEIVRICPAGRTVAAPRTATVLSPEATRQREKMDKNDIP
jgi:hypothetical protein